MGKINRFRIEQRIDVDTDSKDILTTQLLRIASIDEQLENISSLDYRPVVQEILAIGQKAFRENCIHAIVQHFGNQTIAAKALGMQRTYISRIIGNRRRRLQNAKQKLIGNNGNGDDIIDVGPGDGHRVGNAGSKDSDMGLAHDTGKRRSHA